MAKIIDDKIYEFMDNLYNEEYVYMMITSDLENLVGAIHELLKPHIRKIKEAD